MQNPPVEILLKVYLNFAKETLRREGAQSDRFIAYGTISWVLAKSPEPAAKLRELATDATTTLYKELYEEALSYLQ